jgi:hypothetical protein
MGLDAKKVEEVKSRNGENRILIDNVPVWKMILDKVTQVFYLFQVASVCICNLLLKRAVSKVYNLCYANFNNECRFNLLGSLFSEIQRKKIKIFDKR